MNISHKTKEKLVYALVAAAIIPGGFIVLGCLTVVNKFYKELNKERSNKDATKTDTK